MADDLFQRVPRFFAELKRRKVYRVAAVYAAVAFVLIQTADLVFPALNIPSWAYNLTVVLTLFGFPIAVILAWAFEVTPDGVRRTPEVERVDETETQPEDSDRTAYKVLVGLGLVAAVVAAGWYLTGGGGSGPEISDRSVAVLPFEALGQTEAGTVTEGMHSDLQTKLSNVAGLTVTSSRSVDPYRESDKSTEVVARELGVGWIVSGDVARSGNEVQVNVRLVDPETDTQVWTDSYRRDLTAENLFDIQSDITREVARTLEAELSPEETERITRRPTDNLDAYQLYMEGRTHLKRRTEEGTRRATEYFTRAIRQDSSYTLAWVGLADAAYLRSFYGYGGLADSLQVDPERTLQRALAMDSTLAEAYASLGNLYSLQYLDLPRALRYLNRAIDLKPSYARAYQWLSIALLTAGRVDQAVEAGERAVALNPFSPIDRGSLSGMYYAAGRFKDALREVRRARKLAPNAPLNIIHEGLSLAGLGRHSEGIEVLTTGLERSPPGFSYAEVLRAWPTVIRAQAGNTGQARRALKSIDKTPSGYFDRAAIYSALREREKAADALAEATLMDSWYRVAFFRLHPVFEALQGTTEYVSALREVNTSLGLNPDGSLPDSVDVSFGSQTD